MWSITNFHVCPKWNIRGIPSGLMPLFYPKCIANIVYSGVGQVDHYVLDIFFILHGIYWDFDVFVKFGPLLILYIR